MLQKCGVNADASAIVNDFITYVCTGVKNPDTRLQCLSLDST